MCDQQIRCKRISIAAATVVTRSHADTGSATQTTALQRGSSMSRRFPNPKPYTRFELIPHKPLVAQSMLVLDVLPDASAAPPLHVLRVGVIGRE